MKKVNIKIIYIIAGALLISLIVNYQMYHIIRNQNVKIKNLTPLYDENDTISIIKAIFHDNGFIKYIDTTQNVFISKYPYITDEYDIGVLRNRLFYLEGGLATGNNQIMFDKFSLNNDSALITMEFNYYRLGVIDLYKSGKSWKISSSVYGRK